MSTRDPKARMISSHWLVRALSLLPRGRLLRPNARQVRWRLLEEAYGKSSLRRRNYLKLSPPTARPR
jgi:hypothetical protein